MIERSNELIISDYVYNGLNKIASKTKADCWFFLKLDETGNDVVFDLENNSEMEWKDALYQLAESMVDPISEYGLSDLEIYGVSVLFGKFNIDPSKFVVEV